MEACDYADTLSINTLVIEDLLEEERQKDLKQLQNLGKNLRHLHANLLYYRHSKNKKGLACYEAWKALVKQVGCTPDTWRNLGYVLGVSEDDLDYILHTARDDPVDLVLKVFIDKDEEATLDKIMDALVEIKRYDILTKIKSPMYNLAKCFEREDSGYISNNDNIKQQIITFTKFINDLPAALNKNIVLKTDPNRSKKPLQRPLRNTSNGDDTEIYNRILFLTYTPDGYETALNIKQEVDTWTDMTDVTVITLNDRREEVYQNPEKCIREYFEKAYFIVPILTTGYLNSISFSSSGAPSTTENMDFKYVAFIHKLIVNYYMHGTGCRNMKVRSILPKDGDSQVSKNVSMYPELVPWTKEERFEEQFKIFLRL